MDNSLIAGTVRCLGAIPNKCENYICELNRWCYAAFTKAETDINSLVVQYHRQFI